MWFLVLPTDFEFICMLLEKKFLFMKECYFNYQLPVKQFI
jgi:hypothetical protein